MTTPTRDARLDDLAAVNDIYNEYVLNSTATLHEQPVSTAERRAWWAEHEGHFRVLVVEADGQVIGWASLSPYVGRCGYRFTVEDSIYLQPRMCGQGLGKALFAAILERGRAGGFHSVVAAIAADQQPSLRLHEAFGFREVGRLVEVGHKFGRWIDVVLMQRSFCAKSVADSG